MMTFLLGCFVGALMVLLYRGASHAARPVPKAPTTWPDAWLKSDKPITQNDF
jgi:hypothetical protein